MNVHDNIIEILDKNKIKYEAFEHDPSISAKESAAARVGEERESVKSLIFKTDKGKFILVLMSGDQRVKTNLIKKIEGCEDLKLAAYDEVLNISGVPVGAVAPFGLKTKLKTYFYQGILSNDHVWFAAGNLIVSIKIKPKDLLKMIDNPVIFEQ